MREFYRVKMKHPLNLVLIYIILLLFSFPLSAQENHKIEASGDILKIALPLAAFTSTFIWKDNQKGYLQFIKSISLTTAITYGLKWSINKPRPNGDNYGFPSGHTSLMFTSAAFINKRYGWKAGLPAYLLSGYVAWTRVYSNNHDYWDILGGAIIGIGSAYLFTRPYNNSNTKISISKIDQSYNFNIVYHF